MGTDGVKEKDVFTIIEELAVEKQEPTIKLIRDRLGSGSFATISKHLKTWKEQNQKASVPKIPESIFKVAQNLWNFAYKEAEAVLKKDRDDLETEKTKWEKEIEAYRVENEKLEIKLKAMERRHLEINEELERTRKLEADKSTALGKLQQQLSKLEANLESMTDRFKEEKERGARLEKSLSEIAKKK